MNKHILKGNRILATAKNILPYVAVSSPFNETPIYFDGDFHTIVAAQKEYRKALADELDEIEERTALNRLHELENGLINIYIATRYSPKRETCGQNKRDTISDTESELKRVANERTRRLNNFRICSGIANDTHTHNGHTPSWYCAQDGGPFYTAEYLAAPSWMKRHWQNCKKRGTSDDKVLQKMRKWWSYGQRNAPHEKWCEWNDKWHKDKDFKKVTTEIVKWSKEFFHGFRRNVK